MSPSARSCRRASRMATRVDDDGRAETSAGRLGGGSGVSGYVYGQTVRNGDMETETSRRRALVDEHSTLELAVDLEVGVVERFCESVVASGEPVGGAARVGVEEDDDARKRRARRVFGGVVDGG